MIRWLFIPIVFLTLFAKSQVTFEYSDKDFVVGAIHRIAPLDYSTCFRLGNNVEDTIIDSIVIFMNQHPNLIIEVGSHTDSRGSSEYNLKLSEKRAESIVRKLISLGIDSSRLTFKGYGEEQPIISEELISKTESSDEKERLYAVNRRNELKIIKILE
ncbi:MAG: OmpA family protein [Vicingaceae bacterium]|nr:OmpA family protein [Vicingaceae bacterium]